LRLSQRLLEELRSYWKVHRSKSWLFPNAKAPSDPCSTTSAATLTVSRSPMTASWKIEDGEVLLSYRDRKDGDRKKTVTLDAQQFIRRFLLHVLPDGFIRIRHVGFLANRSEKQTLARCHKLLGLDSALPHCPVALTVNPQIQLFSYSLIVPTARPSWSVLFGFLASLKK
jgi:Putative transposase